MTAAGSSPPSILSPRTRRIGLIALALVTLTIVAVGQQLPAPRLIETIRGWAADRGAVGMIGFGAAYVTLALLFVPGAPLSLVAGATYGFLHGFIVVWLSSVVADAVAFLLARHVARRQVERLAKRHATFAAVDRAVADGGWRVVALLRLSPAIPYSASNYLYGLTGIPFWPYLIASAIFTLPGTCLYVYLGFAGAEAAGGRSRSVAEWILIGVGLAATIVVTAYVTRLARRALPATSHKSAPDSAHRARP